MCSPVGPSLIHLLSLAKSYPVAGARPKIALRPTTLALPTDRRLAVLGEKRPGQSVFLRLIAGIERPTRGQVVSSVRLSPIIKPGGLFHPHLSALENIRFFARMLNLDANQLTLAVAASCGAGGVLSRSPKGEGGDRTKAAEMALICLLPFDCYLVDELGQLPGAARKRLRDTAALRQAGIIFATNQPQLARRFAECAIVIRDGIVHPFSNVAEALAFDER